MIYVELDPDGTEPFGLLVIVEAKTGVTYQQQCAGCACEQRTAEGFLIPVGGEPASRKIYDWFWTTFQGCCYGEHAIWTPERITQLETLVGSIPCWQAVSLQESARHTLQLDRERMQECVEAWVPVITPYGRGILVLENSD